MEKLKIIKLTYSLSIGDDGAPPCQAETMTSPYEMLFTTIVQLVREWTFSRYVSVLSLLFPLLSSFLL